MNCSKNIVVIAALTVTLFGAVANITACNFEQNDIFVSGEDGYHTYRIPVMAVMPSGTILAFAEARKNDPWDDGDIDLVMRRSLDNGRTWSNMRIVNEGGDTLAVTIGNPTPIVDRDIDTVFLLFTQNNKRIFVTSSSDDGKTFAEPTELTGIVKQFDFNWTRIGSGPTAGIQTSNGRLIAPVWINQKIGMPDKYRTGAIYSDDHGVSWLVSKVVPVDYRVRGTNESAVIELSDGRLYMTLRTNTGKPARAKSYSSNGGQTWSQAEVSPGINTGMHAIKTDIARYSTKSDSEKSLLLYSAPAAADRNNMTVWISADQGDTWPVSKQIYQGPSGYSELLVLDDETILLLYERGQNKYYEKITLARFDIEWLNDY